MNGPEIRKEPYTKSLSQLDEELKGSVRQAHVRRCRERVQSFSSCAFERDMIETDRFDANINRKDFAS
jgi:hypothetical protein